MWKARGNPPPGWDSNPVGTQSLMTLVRRALGLQFPVQGHANPNIELGVTVDDYTQQEFYVPRGGTLVEAFTSVAAVALKNGVWQLGSSQGILAVVREIHINNFAAGPNSYRWGFTTPDAGMTDLFGEPRDQRGRRGVPSCRMGFGSITLPTNPSGQRCNVAAGSSTIIPVNYVLTGADLTVFKVVSETVNLIGEVGLVWTERPLGPQEG